MQTRRLGRSGLEVSTLCLGTMTFGENDDSSMFHNIGSSEADAHKILDAAVDAGINFIDTADVYGNDGLSERIIGRWFGATGKRDQMVLATKFRFKMADGPNGTGASRRRIVQCVDASLKRLNTDRIDLYQIHCQDTHTPEEEILRALDDLVRSGKVQYIGCSNYAAYRLVDSLWTSETKGLERFVSAQMQYHLLERNIEREHVPVCVQRGVGILPWSPLASGFLTGKYSRDGASGDNRLAQWKSLYDRYATDENWAVVDEVKAVAEELDTSPAAVALAWLIHQPAVSSVIIGARRMSHLEANLAAAHLPITTEQLARLSEVSKLSVGYPYSMIGRVNGSW